MSSYLTNEQYAAQVRKEIVTTAAAMLDAKLSFIEGARVLMPLLEEANVFYDDPDRMIFCEIDSSTDAYPLGTVRAHWSVEALNQLQPEIDEAEKRAREVGKDACEALIRRFNV